MCLRICRMDLILCSYCSAAAKSSVACSRSRSPLRPPFVRVNSQALFQTLIAENICKTHVLQVQLASSNCGTRPFPATSDVNDSALAYRRSPAQSASLSQSPSQSAQTCLHSLANSVCRLGNLRKHGRAFVHPSRPLLCIAFGSTQTLEADVWEIVQPP